MKRIDLFMPVKGPYHVIHHFTKKFAEALDRQGVKTRILEAVYSNPKLFLDKINQDPPDCTLSFNGLLPDDQDRFFCELIKIPHVGCLTYSAPHFVPMIQSPFNVISCADRFDCDFFRGLSFNNTFFMPLGVEKDLDAGESDRIYDVVMLATLIDYIDLRDRWHKEYEPLFAQVLEQSAELVLHNTDMSCVQALVQVLDEFTRGSTLFNPNRINVIHALVEIERYVNGKNQAELISSINSTRVDIFGESPTTTSWKKFIKNNPNVVIHDPVPFEQAIEIMKQSKIVLSSTTSVKNGAHETVLAGLAAGALVLAPENIYLREFFKDGESIAFYHPGSWDYIDDQVASYLGKEKVRQVIAQAGRDVVMRTQTWDHRAEKLLEKVPSILEQMKIQR